MQKIPLFSDLFDGWDEIHDRNLKKQFDHLKSCPIYNGLLCNAMQLFSNKARLAVCAIVVYVKMGKECRSLARLPTLSNMKR